MHPEPLIAWRKTHALTQQQLADLCGVTVRQVRRWETGVSKIPRLLEIYTEEH